eukprot:gnl/MRDRNA2_/MRDRNA2_17710_c0_seq1.p1 gnl/MRDRNA2_/MRDRNA2_17710_c0~~gnl/MRDRNA2_/MRDRNA2_17710_c0_seq1.p1  ORF type:complete len:626 (-),score=99.95 gnl/MRDRNA2_/MRDRNA2_17710_c0_seq1:214-2007(-)
MEPASKRARVTSAVSKLDRRAIQQIGDLDLQEELFLYEMTKQLKAAVATGDQRWIDYLRWNDSNASAYLIFMQEHARNREQFLKAAEFHRLKVSKFMASASTTHLEKRGTITDTIKMLLTYSLGRTVFVIRSELEGVCRWLDAALGPYAQDVGLPHPCFINAGDGVNAHPTHEYQDQFSFLEMKRFSTESIHVALIGDLFHERTAHSKAKGLRIFKKVRVDLVAPPELSLPEEYEDTMRAQGFEVRAFLSLDEYLLKTEDVAEAFYFIRIQWDRMKDVPDEKRASFHAAVALKEEDLRKVPSSTRFFQVLPRDESRPLIPFVCDGTVHNSWDEQMANGYYTKVALVSMLAGVVGPDLQSSSSLLIGSSGPCLVETKDDKPQSSPGPRTPVAFQDEDFVDDFVDNLEIVPRPLTKNISEGIIPISEGVVIDHIGRKLSEKELWTLLFHIKKMMGWLGRLGAEGVYRTQSGDLKGLMSLPCCEPLDNSKMRKLAALAPGCTVNIIGKDKVLQKFRLRLPPRIFNFPSLICRNSLCISNPGNEQSDVRPYFERQPYYRSSALPKKARHQMSADEYLFICKWCDWPHYFWDIWAGFESKEV